MKNTTIQRYKMTVAYDGTAYAGWQVQPRHITIQGELERALKELTGAQVRVESSGRTDSGVHARGQVAHFDVPGSFRPDKLQLGINALIRPDIRVMSLTRAKPDFHARYSATGKEYRYFIWNAPVLDPTARLYRTHIRDPLDVEAMRQTADRLQGSHDFSSFAANPNRVVENACRDLRILTVRKQGPEIMIRAQADGFLYKMVRSLAGFLIRAGRGEVTPETTVRILDSKLRTARVPTAPPEGLFLWKVFY